MMEALNSSRVYRTRFFGHKVELRGLAQLGVGARL
jgi:hypothetical protein